MDIQTETMYVGHYISPLGGITLASDGIALTGLWFDGQKYFPHRLLSECRETELAVFEQTVEWLDIYFSGKAPDFTPPLSLQATPFRKAVCEIMLTIPYGQTMTYGEIAAVIAEQRGSAHMYAQAVGGAVGHNPISLIVPCHRVVGSDGSLTGYAGGLDRKAELLKLEKAYTV
ncbi:MAG: methylated-DNA--[Ruminococcus sp.]|nr:methylated-DNA--[protein]-cysteine S-methyltransferase [Ruminococcus sp.]